MAALNTAPPSPPALTGAAICAATRQAFVDAMAATPTAVTVVATAGPAGHVAQTVSAVASVSADPPSLLVCVNRRSPLPDAVRSNEAFTVSVLHARQTEIADAFAGRGTPDRMPYEIRSSEWTADEDDPPAVSGAAATFTCVLTRLVVVDTHAVIFGAVTGAAREPDVVGAVHCDRRYREIVNTHVVHRKG